MQEVAGSESIKFWIDLIQQVGFPVALSVWLLYKDYKINREFFKVLEKISISLSLINNILGIREGDGK